MTDRLSARRRGVHRALAWTFRLAGWDLRQRRAAVVIGCAAFAVLTLALMSLSVLRSLAAPFARPSASGAVQLVAFMREDLPLTAQTELAGALGRLPGVAQVRTLGSDEVLARLRRELGARAGILDGVEEGFLPATLEVTLDNREGALRADALAWRLRRMEGIADVDVLRSAVDDRVARAYGVSDLAVRTALALAVALCLFGLAGAGLALRTGTRRSRLLASLGFANGAMAAPGALTGALCGLIGASVAGSLLLLVIRSRSTAARLLGERIGDWGGRWALALLVVVVAGVMLGWRGARPSRHEIEDLEAV